MYTRLKDIRRLTGLPETIEVCLQAEAPITCTKFNPFGTILASGCSNGDIILWAWSTRGIARTFSEGHSKAVTSLLWSSDGRQLISASSDGSLVIWDVLSGSKILDKNLDNGEILHVSAVISINNSSLDSTIDDETDWLKKLDEARLLVSFEENEAQIIDMKNINAINTAALLPIPVAALEGPSRGARLLTGQAAASTGQRVASSPCGKYIASAARGVVCLVDADNLSILDAVKIKGSPKKIKTLQFDSSGKQLLVATTDRFVRIYNIMHVEDTKLDNGGGGGGGGNISLEKKELKKGLTMENLSTMAGNGFFQEGSFIHQNKSNNYTATAAATTTTGVIDTSLESSKSTVQLKLTRLFDAQVEKLSWGACAFSPDGEHLVTAIDPGSNEHVIYTWNIFHGYAENTLQAGSDGIVELMWHPEPKPMQCVAVGKSGKIYVWAKVMTQDWSAFAPDFETLTDNREHIEEETEFDVEIAAPTVDDDDKEQLEEENNEDGKAVASGKKKTKKSGSKRDSTGPSPGSKSTLVSGEDEEVDIKSWSWLNNSDLKSKSFGTDEPPPEMWKAGWSAACTAGPLLHLPVVWPTDPVDEDLVEEEMKEKEEEKEEEEGAVLMAVDDDDKEEEKVNGLKDSEEDGEESEKSKKARIE